MAALPANAVTANYLDHHDHPFLHALIDEYRRFAGRPQRELAARLAEPLRVACPPDRGKRAQYVLDRLCKSPAEPGRARADLREVLFVQAASRAPRDEVLEQAAQALACTQSELMAELFADLSVERALQAPPASLGPSELALRANLALVQSLLARATSVRLAVFGNARDIVRYAQLRGLLCVARPYDGADQATELEISGPLSLFRRTRMYGSALASLVPRLVWCDRFELRAECLIGQRSRVLCVRSGDPIFPSEPPARFDSKLEQRFARDFARAAPDWELTREPVPVAVSGSLIFPDFAIVHRRDPRRRVLLEIVGFWTPAYLASKLARLRTAAIAELIMCIDATLNCGPDDLPEHARVVRYRRSIDVQAVLKLIES